MPPRKSKFDDHNIFIYDTSGQKYCLGTISKFHLSEIPEVEPEFLLRTMLKMMLKRIYKYLRNIALYFVHLAN